jgi:tRNA nucleotidyltransferase/poly(A) polymerase
MKRRVGGAGTTASVEKAVAKALARDGDLRRLLLALSKAVTGSRGAAYLAGGYLRDIAAGKPGADVDVMVAGLSRRALGDVLAALPRARLGIRKVIYAGKHFPVFRVATAWSDRYIDISAARGHGEAHGWAPFAFALADAARRDFTINSLLYELFPKGNRLAGELVDAFGGVGDLASRRIRCVGSPKDRLQEDPLRALRAIRMRSEWKGFAIAPSTFRAIRRLGPALLPGVPGDRLVVELLRSLQANPQGTIADLRRAGILRVLLPELTRRKGGAVRVERRYGHLGRSSHEALPPTILLANLLVDLPPPVAEAAARRLRFPNVRQVLSILAGLRRLRDPKTMRFPRAEAEAILRRHADPGPFIALYRATGACDGARGKDLKLFIMYCLKTPVFINGSDLKGMGFPEGPEREEALLAIREATLAGKVRTRKEALQAAGKMRAAGTRDGQGRGDGGTRPRS